MPAQAVDAGVKSVVCGELLLPLKCRLWQSPFECPLYLPQKLELPQNHGCIVTGMPTGLHRHCVAAYPRH